MGDGALCMYVTCVTTLANMGLVVMARHRSVAVRQRPLRGGMDVFMPSVRAVFCVR